MAVPFGSRFHLSVRDMRVSKRHVPVAEQARYHRQRNALHDRMAGEDMPQIVQANVFQTGPLPRFVPKREAFVRGSRRVRRRRKDIRALRPRLAFDDRPGPRVQENLPRPRLAVRQDGSVYLPPLQTHDFVSSATGREQQADDVRLPPAERSRGRRRAPVQFLLQAADFLPRQKAGEFRARVSPDASRRILLDQAAATARFRICLNTFKASLGSTVPGSHNFSRFLSTLAESKDPWIGGMVWKLREQLGYDGKAVDSHSTGQVSRKTGKTSDPDANWGKQRPPA